MISWLVQISRGERLEKQEERRHFSNPWQSYKIAHSIGSVCVYFKSESLFLIFNDLQRGQLSFRLHWSGYISISHIERRSQAVKSWQPFQISSLVQLQRCVRAACVCLHLQVLSALSSCKYTQITDKAVNQSRHTSELRHPTPFSLSSSFYFFDKIILVSQTLLATALLTSSWWVITLFLIFTSSFLKPL